MWADSQKHYAELVSTRAYTFLPDEATTFDAGTRHGLASEVAIAYINATQLLNTLDQAKPLGQTKTYHIISRIWSTPLLLYALVSDHSRFHLSRLVVLKPQTSICYQRQ